MFRRTATARASAPAPAPSARPRRGHPVKRALTGILIFQLGLALLLFLGDIGRDFSLPRPGTSVPRFDTPARPGDQTRRYDPGALPATRPGGPDVAPSGPMPNRLTLEVTGDAIVLTGTIAPGDAERIAGRIAGLEDRPDRVVLNSSGGSVADALALGRGIRAAGMDTAMRASDICLSACPYILAGGVTRDVAEGARVGVHQHYFGENTLLPAFTAVSSIQRGQGEVMRYLDEMGVDPMVMSHALVTPPDEIYLLLPEELERYRLTFAP